MTWRASVLWAGALQGRIKVADRVDLQFLFEPKNAGLVAWRTVVPWPAAWAGESTPATKNQDRGHLSLGSLFARSSPKHELSAKSPGDRGVSIRFTSRGLTTIWSQVPILGAPTPQPWFTSGLVPMALRPVLPQPASWDGVFGYHSRLAR